MKLNKKQIDLIVKNTPSELKGTQAPFESDFGWFMRYGANWSYQAGFTRHNGVLVLVVRVFGVVQ